MNGKRLIAVLAACWLVCLAGMTGRAEVTQSWEDFLASEGISAMDEQRRAHILTTGQTETALNVALTVEGLYYDGETFLLGWRAENLTPRQPALVLCTDVMINAPDALGNPPAQQYFRTFGVPVRAFADHPTSLWYPRVFGLFAAGEPINNLMWGFDADMEAFDWSGEAEVSIHFVVKRPVKPIAVVDPEIHIAYDDADTENDRLNMLEAMQAHGVTVAQAGDTDIQAWRDKGYLVLNRYGEHYLENEADGRAALSGLDLPDAEEQPVVISFRVNLDALAGK